MKDIKDYLHLYLGSPCVYQWHHRESEWLEGKITPAIITPNAVHSVKPILRPLSDMTDEEMEEVWHLREPKNVLEMNYKNSSITRKVALCSERTIYLLSKGFDLFNLIPENLAIDKTKL